MNCPETTSLVGVSVAGVVVPDITLPRNSLPGVDVSDVMIPGNSLPGDDLSDIALPGVASPKVVDSLSLFPSDLLVGSPLIVVSRASRTDSMDPERIGVAA